MQKRVLIRRGDLREYFHCGLIVLVWKKNGQGPFFFPNTILYTNSHFHFEFTLALTLVGTGRVLAGLEPRVSHCDHRALPSVPIGEIWQISNKNAPSSLNRWSTRVFAPTMPVIDDDLSCSCPLQAPSVPSARNECQRALAFSESV